MPAPRWVGLALIALLLTLLPAGPAAAQEIAWPASEGVMDSCIDATRPDTLLLSYRLAEGPVPPGSYSFNMRTGERLLLSEAPFWLCNRANGLLYGYPSQEMGAPQGAALLFSSYSPRPLLIDRLPTHLAADGSLWAYAFDGRGEGGPDQLWASPDGGRSWLARPLPAGQPALDIAVANADARAIYLLTSRSSDADELFAYTVFFSPDGGATWERRGSGTIGDPYPPQVSLGTFASPAAPVGSVLIAASNGHGRYASWTTYLSTDGGRSFASAEVTPREPEDMSYSADVVLLHTRAGLLRASGGFFTETIIERSADGGASWERLPALPFTPYRDTLNTIFITQAPAAPDVLVMVDDSRAFWLTIDAGRTWEPLEGVTSLGSFSPSLPLRLITSDGERHTLREIPGAERALLAPALPKALPGGAFFPEAGHNLGEPFRAHWERGGGLALFGYPISEPFRERNPADGRLYLVQYFERNRFEYHPELAGTPGEVQLGLLGSELTAARRAAGEAPFRPVARPTAAGARFFPETGHTLGGAFRAHWERGGGLAVFGYPISEPFRERNPADGRLYLVQYFERNRFELHPELAGTPGEVQLGLLGRQVLDERGWRR